MRLDDLPGDREPEPGPSRLRREERLEDALLKLGRDGGALVRDRDPDRAVVHQPLNGDLAVAAGFQRILDQVGEDLAEKHRVAINGQERSLDRQGRSPARPRRDQALEELLYEDGLPALRLGMREAQERFDESFLAVDRLEGSLRRPTGKGPSTPSSGRPRKRARSDPRSDSAVTLNTRRRRAASTSSIATGSRARMSLSETKRSIESVRRPTAASSAPSSSETRSSGLPSVVGAAASVRSTMAQIRLLEATPSSSPPSPARAPAATAAANSPFCTSGAQPLRHA